MNLIFLCLFSFLSNAQAETIQVSAASSLTDVLSVAAKKFEQQQSIKVALSFDASSRLARQIAEGAPADIFFSADRSWADDLDQKKMLKQRKDLLSNSLVVIAPAPSKILFNQLAELKQLKIAHIAIAQETVPAGKYASEALKKAGVLGSLRGKIISGDNVRQVLSWVAKDEADLGIVFKTDMLVEKKVKQVYAIPADQHSSVVYVLTLLSPKLAAKKFFDYLSTAECKTLFVNAGFVVLN